MPLTELGMHCWGEAPSGWPTTGGTTCLLFGVLAKFEYNVAKLLTFRKSLYFYTKFLYLSVLAKDSQNSKNTSETNKIVF